MTPAPTTFTALDRPSLKPLRPHQQVALDLLKQSLRSGHRRPMLQLPTGAGKCLGLGTPVMKFDGTIIPVEDVVAGDMLMGPDSLPRAVLTTCRGTGPLFRIVPVKGEPWVCNDVHVLTLVDCVSGREIDIALDEYLVRSKTFKHTHKQFAPRDGIDFMNDGDPDVDAYWLGLWLGDGTKALNGVGVSKPDVEVAASCSAVADAHGLQVRTDRSGTCPTYHLSGGKGRGGRGSGNPLLDKLRDLFGRPATKFPHAVRIASRLYRQEFMAGVIDSDGYVNNNCVEIAQRSVPFADGIAFVARSLGLRVLTTPKIVNGVTYQRMSISGDFAGIVTRIPRKGLEPRRQTKCATRTGFSVEPIGIGEYAGFELSGDGRFLLGDFTVTHNTVVAAHIVTGARGKGNRVAFNVPSLSLIDQTFERFAENGIDPADMGVMQADHPWTRPHAPVQICSVHTLARRGWPDVPVAVVDEAHIRNEVIDRWMAEATGTVFIGLSATPWPKGLGKLYDDLIQPITMADLIEQGYLSRFRVYAPTHPDLTGVKTVAGDYHEGQLAERMSDAKLVADVVSTWLARANGLPTLCFGVNRAHAQLLADQFERAGVTTAYIDANTAREDRERIKARLRAGDVKVICNIGTMTTGVDEDIRCIVLARPTKSEMLFVQIIGRGLRTAPGKDHCVILDHSDTHLRLGMVTEIEHDTLDDGSAKKAKGSDAKERKLPLPKECQQCTGLVPAGARSCPCCGAEQKRPTNVEQVDGELGEFSGRGKRPAKGPSSAEVLRSRPKSDVYAEIIGLKEERGRSSGWAAHTYKAIYGVWPRGFNETLAAMPSGALRSFVRSRDIAWAKSQKATEASHAA